MNLANNLERSARFFGERIAVIDGDKSVTYGELNRQSGLAASGLRALGVQPGDFLALCAPNSAQWLAFYFAALKCGAIAVTLSPLLSPQELSRLLGHGRPKVLFTSNQISAALKALNLDFGVQWTVCGDGDLDFDALMARGNVAMQPEDRQPDDPACVLYTGGTTGLPKGVLLTHENVLTAIHGVVFCERSTHEDRSLCFLPFNHVFGQMHIMNATVLSGGSLVLMPAFDMEKAFQAIEDHGITKLFAVPTVYVRMLQVPQLKERLGAVRYCFSAAASMAREIVEQWRAATGLNIHEAYGMTETASLVTYNHYYRHKVGSVGATVGTTEVCILDTQGLRLPQGREGEICIRGRNVMKGYLANPKATEEALRDGWLHSGDVGYLDDEGYLFIVDRLKDLIISGGENVYPREVEEVLYERPEVSEVAVIGLPDAEYGERVTAYLTLKPGATLDPAQLKAFCKERMAAFKVPKQFLAVESLPTTPTGKILKRELRKKIMEQEPKP